MRVQTAMRILIVSDAWKPQMNGVVRTYEDLIRELERGGHVVRVIGPADFSARFPMPGYREIELVRGSRRPLRRMVDAFRPDTIHIATEGPLGWAMRKICLQRRWPFTTAYHTHFPDYVALRVAAIAPWLDRPARALAVGYIRRFHRPATFILSTTASVDRALRGWRLTRLHRLTRGVDTSIFHPGPKTLFQQLQKPIALFVGRLAIEKNIEAFISMPWKGTKIIVGDGPDKAKLEASAPANTVFAGRKSGIELADHYRSADVFVFPSRTDTFGIVLIEAMACGLPIAGFPVPGPVDVVTDQAIGAVNPVLAEAAVKALDAPGTREDRYHHLVDHFSWPEASAQFLEAQTLAQIIRN